MVFGIFAHRAVSAKARRQPRHALPHPLEPCGGNAALVPGIKLRAHLPLEQVVERVGFDSVPSGIVAMLPAVPQLSLIHISEPTRLGMTSYAVFCLKKKN